jgi:hypothetical protein
LFISCTVATSADIGKTLGCNRKYIEQNTLKQDLKLLLLANLLFSIAYGAALVR